MPRRSLQIIAVALAVWLACQARLGLAQRSRAGRMVVEALAQIEARYLEPVDQEHLLDGALTGVMSRLDQYSAYLNRDAFREVEEDLEQQFGGIGVQVQVDEQNGWLTVLSPIVGTPAFEAGLKAGDQIRAIDGKNIQGLKLDQARRLLRGAPGTPVRIGLVRPLAKADAAGENGPSTEPKLEEVTLVRAVIETESVRGDLRGADQSWNFLLSGTDRIGYLRILPMFSERTLDELRGALEQLQAAGARGAILDLRWNPGGLLDSAVGVCRLLVAEGRIVSTRGRGGVLLSVFDADGTAPFAELPLVVLVNRNSASASEIVAACLQDHQRAAIVGERTWGKGSVQDVILLEGADRALKLTTASYWRPSEQNIHRLSTATEADAWGVRPDPNCEVRLDDREQEAYFQWRSQRDVVRPGDADAARAAAAVDLTDEAHSPDKQLAKAIAVLEARIEGQAVAGVTTDTSAPTAPEPEPAPQPTTVP